MTSGKQRPIIIVQGAQWGSEAKGAVAAALVKKKAVTYAVRTGAVNAGHTVMWDGEPIKMQQLPTAWVVPGVTLVLGAGAYIQPQILAAEIDMVSRLTGSDIRERLLIDNRVSLHLPEHQQQAKLENRHHAIGATGKGCSVAITDKIRYRGKGYRLFKEWNTDTPDFDDIPGLRFTDTVEVLHDAYDAGQQILLEGTQGSLLDLNLGPYPYTTHKPTQAINWAMEAGLSLGMQYEVVMVARTYPIRVAGNSGPMDKETTWPNVARTINRKLMLNRLPQRVKSYAIDEFEAACHQLANGRWKDQLPQHLDGSSNYDFHKWPVADRLKHKVAISEFHADVIAGMSEAGLREIDYLFERTTVTKKLRRVAEWNGADVKWSSRVNRGDYIVLTFFNYWAPEIWDHTTIGWSQEYERLCYQVEKDAGIPVRYITTGPGTDNLIRVDGIRSIWRNEHHDSVVGLR